MTTLAVAVTVIAVAVSVRTPAAAQPRPVQRVQQAPEQAPGPHTVTFDKYSMMIDGRRTFVWSGEFHPFRLPSPGLWRDVLQKMRAEGYTAVSIYFDWGYHSAAPGSYDFTGVRDMDRLLDIADEVGLYVIARPGPYINGEVTAGGFPGWLTTQAGRARSDAADYLAAVDEWFTHIDAILARHQLTNGTGSVILYQIENELASTGTSQRNYMQHMYDKVRADGITVPIFSNDKGRNGIWVPSSSTVPGTVPGPVDLYAFDGYPGGTCHTDNSVGGPSTAPDWGMQGAGGAKGGATASPQTPGFAAEFGGGWFDYWGSLGSYPCTAIREGPGYERVFYETNIANGLTLQNFYMTFGGTSWGWLPAPVVYTSYDYGAAIDEARQPRPKATAMREIGYFLQSVPDVAMLDKGSPVVPSVPNIKVYHDVNPETGTAFYIAMHNPSNATTNDAFSFPLETADGSYQVPQQGTLRINGQDAKTLVADYDLDGQHLVYSTSEIMTHFAQGSRDVALLHGRDGEDGETVLRYATPPAVDVLGGDVASQYDATSGDLRLNYTHQGLAEVQISGGGRRPLLLLLADDTTAGTFWRQDTAAGPVLERGPELVRTATARPGSLALTGDTAAATDLELWVPASVHHVTWNDETVPVAATGTGSLAARQALAAPQPVTLPDLSAATWRSAPESPEAQPTFDDATWQSAGKTSTNSTTKPPAGQPVLTADDYGFHQGDVWYRGSLGDLTSAATMSIRYGGGGAGMLQAWLDGQYLGQNVLGTGVASPPTTGTAAFTLPAGLRTAAPHTLAVMVRDDSHNEDGGVNDAQKEGRGIISVAYTDDTGAPAAVPASWKVQGNQGGEDIVDTTRGPMNNGGLYGERAGWYLPGYPDADWSAAAVPAASADPGTTWYRTTFHLDVPRSDDASLGITIGDPAVPRSTANYRALIFVNGWNMGQYIANVGPQHTFVVPTGVLNPHGANTLAIAVTSDGGAGNGLEQVALTNIATVRGGVAVPVDESPGYLSPRLHVPDQLLGGRSVDATVADLQVPADAQATALQAKIAWGDGTSSDATVAGGAVSGQHTYARPGAYRVTVTVADRYGGATLADAAGWLIAR